MPRFGAAGADHRLLDRLRVRVSAFAEQGFHLVDGDHVADLDIQTSEAAAEPVTG